MTRQYHMPYANYAQKDCKLISSIFHFFHPKQHRRRLKLLQACLCLASFRHMVITCNPECTLKSNMQVMSVHITFRKTTWSACAFTVGFHHASSDSNQICIISKCTSVLF